jgi:two-component system, chemotaxis family, protein-glutamate methylesterase/glutaminase
MTPEFVAIGTSLGGLSALEILLAGLAPDLRLPVAVVQHRSRAAGDALLSHLRGFCALPLDEVEDKQPIQPGRVYLAPADYHLLVDGNSFALTIGPRVCHARPSIDVLFESAAMAFRQRLIGIVLTGASRDGAEGAQRIKERGGTLLVQDPTTAENPIMPSAALAAATADHILKLEEIAPFLNRAL